MDSNHRSALCKRAAFAARPQDHVAKVDSPGVAPGTDRPKAGLVLRHATPVSSYWTISPCCSAEVEGLEPPSGQAAGCFQNSVLIQPDDFRPKLRELESNQRPPVSETGIAYQQRRSRSIEYPFRGTTAPALILPHRSAASVALPTAITPHHSLFYDTCLYLRFASSCGGRSRTCGHMVQSHVFLPTETTPQK